jgi:hypothetical protein
MSCIPFRNCGEAGIWSEARSNAIAWARLSKIIDYLVDNMSYIRLSKLGRGVNDKTRGGTEAPEAVPGLENRETSGTRP